MTEGQAFAAFAAVRDYKWRGRKCGTLTQDGRFFSKTVSSEKHLARRWDGYGIQADLLQLLIDAGVEFIFLTEHRLNGSVVDYKVTPLEWRDLGHPDTLRQSDGPQVFITRRRLLDLGRHGWRKGPVPANQSKFDRTSPGTALKSLKAGEDASFY